MKGDGGGDGGRKISHVETLKFLSVLEDHTLLCSWKNPRSGEGEIPISQIGGLRPGADRESNSVTTYWLAKAFGRDSNSFPWAPRRLLLEPHPPASPSRCVHLLTHRELSAQLCQALSRAADSR